MQLPNSQFICALGLNKLIQIVYTNKVGIDSRLRLSEGTKQLPRGGDNKSQYKCPNNRRYK